MSAVIERPAIVNEGHLNFLDDLRESGITNMYGAASYLRDEFGLGEADSVLVLVYWMRTFSERHV
jgi:hypothetical protein